MEEGTNDQLIAQQKQQPPKDNETTLTSQSSASSSSSSHQNQLHHSLHLEQQVQANTNESSSASSTSSSSNPLAAAHPSQKQGEQQSSSSSSSLTLTVAANTTITTTTGMDNELSQTNNTLSSSSSAASSSSINNAAIAAATNNATSSSSSTQQITKNTPSSLDLFSTERWGTTPIRQDTPWELPPSPTQTTSNSSSSAPAAVASLQQANLASGPASLPPGISQSSDSFRSAGLVNNYGIDSMANSLGQMQLGSSMIPSTRFDQPWRAPAMTKQAATMGAVPFANHNLINPASGGLQKSMLNTGNGSATAPSFGVGVQHGGDFARAPGPASSMVDNNMTPKPFGMANRSSTWSAFGTPGPNEPEPEWPKMSTGGISAASNSSQPSNAFDLVPEFESGKSWPTRLDLDGSMFMKRLDDETAMGSNVPGLAVGAGYANSSKSPTEGQYEPSGIGTWSPVVKGGRSDSKWGDNSDNGPGDNGRFDDGTAIWGSPAQSKAAGVDWADKTGDANSNNDKSRSAASNNSSYRPQQPSSSNILLMSNTSPSNQHGNRNQQALKQPSSHNFDQVQQQSNALSSQVNQPNRAMGLSSNVPSTQHLKHMVQQIQLAVQVGHLNPQILNQPLAPVTLQLLYQLLQQIKILQQLQIQASQQQFNKSGGQHPAAVNVHITKTKQNILNLQNQIAAQQAVYLKQTQAQNISSRQAAMPNMATGGLSSGMSPALPPGISQSSDNFRSSGFVNNFNADGMANNLGQMHLGASNMMPNRFDQPWRAPAVAKQQVSGMGSLPFSNHNLINQATGGMQKSMLNSGNGNTGGSSYGVGMQQGGDFARAPGPASSMVDNNMTPKPFGMANRSSTWSAFGTPGPNEPEPEWPKMSTGGISAASNSSQPSNAFDLVPEFEPGKPWRGSMLMKSVEDDPTMTPGSMARSLAPQRKTIWSDEIL